ncbi:MAG: hypothetical protein H7177_06805 [Rhizobacter sp.]|nr:hypothetical protein [Bacteriovorax sp.]
MKDRDQVVSKYYEIKNKMRFLGELEIYSAEEFNTLKQFDNEILNLYSSIRKVRQINWLKNRAIGTLSRGKYHRLKDIRKIFILFEDLHIKSAVDVETILFPFLYNITGPEFEFAVAPLHEDFHFYCDYLCQKIKIKTSDQKNIFFLLSCLPLKHRNISLIDSPISELRKINPSVEKVLIQLNQIELMVATAYIRGCQISEPWHDKWLADLSFP